MVNKSKEMTDHATDIKFAKSKSNFYKDLCLEVQNLVTEEHVEQARKLILVKMFFYATLNIFFYSLLYVEVISTHSLSLVLCYTLFGLSGILLAFNCSHDAVHNTLFRSKSLNRLVHYLVFNLQGVNATLWKKRHIHSHHIFPNVDGCDSDIDDNSVVRLSQTHALKPFHKYQHLYAPILYCFYTLHWIFVKDFVYLGRTRVANMKDLSYSASFVGELILLKLLYFTYIIILPWLFTGAGLGQILIAFVLMHFFISIFFVLTLIISHLTEETAFPVANPETGVLPFDYYEHQLSVSLDYHPTSKFANWIFGGFNSHSAHHLFPHLRHTLYVAITPAIKATAKKYNLPYNELSMGLAIKSHFLFLKRLGINKNPAAVASVI